jgi:hypothetical protein
MYEQLNGRFPYIKRILEDGYPPKLKITIEEGKDIFSIYIDFANPNDKNPYTKETLEKAIAEFPEKYQEGLRQYKENLRQNQEDLEDIKNSWRHYK